MGCFSFICKECREPIITDQEKSLRPFDKIICAILIDKYSLPYSIGYICDNIKEDYCIPKWVAYKSILRLEQTGLLHITADHVFISPVPRVMEYIKSGVLSRFISTRSHKLTP